MTHFCNFISIINRAAKQQQICTNVRNTTYIRLCLKKLITLGYIRGFAIRKDFKFITVYLKYDSRNNCAIRGIRGVSRPGKRVYVRYKHFNRLAISINSNASNGAILSTSLGLLTCSEAAIKKVGGEILFIIV